MGSVEGGGEGMEGAGIRKGWERTLGIGHREL